MSTISSSYARTGYDRRNFWLLASDSGAFSFAQNMFSHLTIIPYYLSQLTDSATIIGLGPLIFILGMYLPQAFSANLVNGLHRRKPYLVFWAVAERVGILLMWLAVVLFSTAGNWLSIGVFLLCYSVFTVTIGMMFPAHADLVARSIVSNRGMFYGVANFVGGLAGIAGANLTSFFLDSYPFPRDFVFVFGVPLAVTVASLLFWIYIREPEYDMPVQKRSLKAHLIHLKGIVASKMEFRRFLTVRIVLNLAEVATPFYGVYAAAQFDLAPGVFGMFTLTMFVSQSLSNLMWGTIGDRYGFKAVLQIAAGFGFLAGVLALVAPRYEFFFVVYVLIGAMFSAALISNVNLGIEYSSSGETPTYVGLVNSSQAIPLAFAPVVGGIIADATDFSVTITVGTVLFVMAFIYATVRMIDPRHVARAGQQE